jgi:hypothetical protein
LADDHAVLNHENALRRIRRVPRGRDHGFGAGIFKKHVHISGLRWKSTHQRAVRTNAASETFRSILFPVFDLIAGNKLQNGRRFAMG